MVELSLTERKSRILRGDLAGTLVVEWHSLGESANGPLAASIGAEGYFSEHRELVRGENVAVALYRRPTVVGYIVNPPPSLGHDDVMVLPSATVNDQEASLGIKVRPDFTFTFVPRHRRDTPLEAYNIDSTVFSPIGDATWVVGSSTVTIDLAGYVDERADEVSFDLELTYPRSMHDELERRRAAGSTYDRSGKLSVVFVNVATGSEFQLQDFDIEPSGRARCSIDRMLPGKYLPEVLDTTTSTTYRLPPVLVDGSDLKLTIGPCGELRVFFSGFARSDLRESPVAASLVDEHGEQLRGVYAEDGASGQGSGTAGSIPAGRYSLWPMAGAEKKAGAPVLIEVPEGGQASAAVSLEPWCMVSIDYKAVADQTRRLFVIWDENGARQRLRARGGGRTAYPLPVGKARFELWLSDGEIIQRVVDLIPGKVDVVLGR